jgi:hypothetical protein
MKCSILISSMRAAIPNHFILIYLITLYLVTVMSRNFEAPLNPLSPSSTFSPQNTHNFCS